jgi:choline kinase
MSTRMQSVSGGQPKCLIPVGGKPILQRTLDNIFSAGIREIGIVTGYRSGDVRAFVKKQFPSSRIQFMVNPKFDSTNNAFSLLMARNFYKKEENEHKPLKPLLLLDSDIVFSARLLEHLQKQKSLDCLAVRVMGNHNEEEIRVKVDGSGTIVQIGKDVPLSETYGESIGIEMLSPATATTLFDVLERRIRKGAGRTEFYEASFQEMIVDGVKLSAVDVSDFPSAEIDTPEDLQEVERSLIPILDSAKPG